MVKHNGKWYKKVNGKWKCFGKNKNGRGPGWTFEGGYWFYNKYAYVKHKGLWYRYYENAWHKYGSNLPPKPDDPHGKYRVETPTSPHWPKGKPKPKALKHTVKTVHHKAAKHHAKVVKAKAKAAHKKAKAAAHEKAKE